MAKNKMHTTHSSSQFVSDEWGCWKWCQYAIFMAVSIILLLGASALITVLMVNYRSPLTFDWKKKPLEAFHLHPILMVTGFITLSGLSTLTFRMCRCFKRLCCKLFHTIIHVLAAACVAMGFIFAFYYTKATGKEHFYSMHSWLGLITISIFGLQFIFGFFTFLFLACCQNSTACFRARMIPIHSAMGLATFFLAVATCLTGMMQEFIAIDSALKTTPAQLSSNFNKTLTNHLNLPTSVSFFNTPHFLFNVLATVLVALVIMLAYLFRGPPRPDTDALPIGGWSANQGVKQSGSRCTVGTY